MPSSASCCSSPSPPHRAVLPPAPTCANAVVHASARSADCLRRPGRPPPAARAPSLRAQPLLPAAVHRNAAPVSSCVARPAARPAPRPDPSAEPLLAVSQAAPSAAALPAQRPDALSGSMPHRLRRRLRPPPRRRRPSTALPAKLHLGRDGERRAARQRRLGSGGRQGQAHTCTARPHVKVETLVEAGDPRGVICDAAEKIGADLLVMGTHGYGFIQRAFLGSVSNHCVQNCKCPVLIVKRPKG